MSKSDAQSEKLIVGDVAVKPDGEKLQKVLARMGLGSRRKLEESIQAGEITPQVILPFSLQRYGYH